MRNWLLRHPVRFMLYYAGFYFSFFFLLEHFNPVPELVLHCRLDDMIPFCKYAIVPYCLWFVWIGGALLFFLLRAPRAEFWRMCLPLFAGMTLSLLFCAVVPNGVYLRPLYVPGSDVFARAVRLLYRSDTATNVFPSIHVFNSVTLDMAFQRSSCFAGRRGRPVRVAMRLLDISIILSTLLLKQHSVLDATAGLILALGIEWACVRLWREPRMLGRRQATTELPEWL